MPFPTSQDKPAPEAYGDDYPAFLEAALKAHYAVKSAEDRDASKMDDCAGISAKDQLAVNAECESRWAESGRTVYKPGFNRRPEFDPSYPHPQKVSGKDALATQEGGGHYKGRKIQPVEYIEANKIPFLEGCIIKRATRHEDKLGGGVKDLKKIIHEARLIAQLRYGVDI